jgi:hypothetical protein
MSNRHLLLALAGLGGLNALLCLMMLFRENINGARVTHQGGEQQKSQRTLEEIKTLLAETREELASIRKAVARYEAIPWLNRSGGKPPWLDEIQRLNARLAKLEKAQDMQLLPAKPPGLNPLLPSKEPQ